MTTIHIDPYFVHMCKNSPMQYILHIIAKYVQQIGHICHMSNSLLAYTKDVYMYMHHI